MTSQLIPVDPFDFVIFGGTGDLAERKLLPALYYRQSQFSEPTRIISASRAKLSESEFKEFSRKAIVEHVKESDINETELNTFLGRMSYVPVDAITGEGFSKLKKVLGNSNAIRAFYLAVAPSLFGEISHRLKETDLITANSRIVVEKPIGRDLASARALNDQIGADFGEHQIFRIDHYLGKETVQNLMALRFANMLFEPLWNSAHIDHVQITVAETVGLEDRVTYYDKAGALRDMVQNHILQLLCLVAMEAPSSMDANAVRDEKLKVLHSLKRINGAEAPKSTVRGQYRAGASSGGAVKGYLEELGNPNSSTETFVAIKADIANWRWAGVPFYLRTGKRLASRVSEIVIEFKRHTSLDLRRERRPHPAEPTRHPAAARRRREAMDHDQGSGSGRHAAAPDRARHDLRRHVPGAQSRRLRAADHGRHPRQPDAVHAPRRGRGGLEMDRPDLQRLGRQPSGCSELYFGHLGSIRFHRVDRARRTHLARGLTQRHDHRVGDVPGVCLAPVAC